ncbi:ParB/RepB/Spo0J family partition protein [Donghicola sp. XS_ASV15]|uniref:ParB/RepB/Spo0J family partition protein n=1 Tax=Donghicola sp. XS_ASV15 TaxID=3241295 RepID=UPI00351555FE
MAKKRRMFDINMPTDLPADTPEAAVPSSAPAPRRGPMATAISEAANSTRQRQEIEAKIRAENDALAHEHVRLKGMGLIMELVPLNAISTSKLTRDRAKGPDLELAELKQSISEIGLSNPIRLETRSDGLYELVQGYRRLSAYRELFDATGHAEFSAIPAVVTEAGDTLEDLYRRMVDENLVRKDISFGEMAKLALEYANDPETEEHDADKAVATLFKSAGYQKRSYIRNFIRVVRALDGHLKYLPQIPRSLGLALAAAIEAKLETGAKIAKALDAAPSRTAEEELEILRGFANDGGAKVTAAKKKSASPAPTRSTFSMPVGSGSAKCTAARGKLEIKLDRDFSSIDQARLEAAIKQLLTSLD